VWPIPDEAGTIRFQTQVLSTSANVGADTLDYRLVWTQYLIWEMAHQFAVAKSLPIQKLSYLRKVAKEKKEYAKMYGGQHVNNYMRYAHQNRWRGR
jgi:hypothetical protein